MGILFEWNRTDLSQFASAGSPDQDFGGATGSLSVVNVSERGNVLRYTGSGGAGMTQVFMLGDALAFTDSVNRNMQIELELYDANFGSGGYCGPFFLADATGDHGFGHAAMGASEWQSLLNNGVVERSSGTGVGMDTFARFFIHAEKPASAAPRVSSYADGWNFNSGRDGEPRRSGSNSTARGGVSEFGNSSTLGSSWDSLGCDYAGLIYQSSGVNPAPTQVDILTFRIRDFEGASAEVAAPTLADVSPSPQTLDLDQPLSFSVLGADTRVLVAVEFGGLAFTELVHDGDNFTTRYRGTSSVVSISGGSRYTILRNPAWPAAPTVRVFAFAGGAEL